MKFAIVATKEDAINFCADKNCYYITGTYKEKAQDYLVTVKDLQPGKTYYFCAFNDTYGFTAASQYKIIPVIIAY